MMIVQADEVHVVERASSGREGTYRVRNVLNGEDGSPGNFSLKIYNQNGSFGSPRHRHNFDQFRYQIDGDADFGPTGRMHPGTLGYFPEGAHYGPQSGPPHVVAVLQFGGPSGSGYLSSGQHRSAIEELKQTGVFEKGIYRRKPGVEGKPNQDAYEAVWEHVNRRELVYPEPQYANPILLDTGHYPWLPLDTQPGVAERALGTFTSCRIRAAQYRLDAGAELTLPGRGVYLFLSGAGTLGQQPFRALTAVYLDTDDTIPARATENTEVLLMGMPELTLMSRPAAQGAAV